MFCAPHSRERSKSLRPPAARERAERAAAEPGSELLAPTRGPELADLGTT